MSPKPPQCLTCDHCYQPIAKKNDGWVEWWSHEKYGQPGFGLRVVHHCGSQAGRCQYRENYIQRDGVFYSLSDNHLACFLGEQGLSDLLDMIESGRLPPTEVIPVIRRLHTPSVIESSDDED